MGSKDIRVLLVDDEETLIEYMSKRLLREGFTVRTTTSGEEAIDVASNEDFDVAVVDLKMPGMDGIETQKRLKKLRPYLQVVVLTGHSSIETALESGKHDAFRYLKKPADHDELVRAIDDANARKVELKHAMFEEEMSQIPLSGANPRGIVRAIQNLRKKYGFD